MADSYSSEASAEQDEPWEVCIQCKFWEPLSERWGPLYDGDVTEAGMKALENIGACRRFPPTREPISSSAEPNIETHDVLFLPLVEGGTEQASYPRTEFPVTNMFDWCGEFKWRKAGPRDD
jgi:hypothetical protein